MGISKVTKFIIISYFRGEVYYHFILQKWECGGKITPESHVNTPFGAS